MFSTILNQQLQKFRSQVDEIVKDLHELTIQIQHPELAQTVSELRNRINEPFMFVIVGEVKAGKSSFINALLDTGREITKVAVQPMTDTIQQIVYGEKEEVIVINPLLKRITVPVDILKEIAIVDTPGTNTIIEKHQEITERFIPASDLIVFVFEAKNPYRQSAWDFFDYIHGDWRKKIIFVLQQKDLMNAADLAINEKGVVEYAQKKGISEPLVFPVSAKQEQEGDKTGSGFGPMREYIRDNITGGKAPILKLRNNLDLSRNICERIAQGLETRQTQWDADTAFRADIRDTLDKQAIQSQRQVGILVENLLAGYDRITREKADQLQAGLSVFTLIRRTIAGIFSKQASAKEWLENLANELGTDLEMELQRKLQEGVVDLAESIQQMAKMIDLKIQNSQTILKHNHAIFSAIAERRSNVLRELQDAFERFMSRAENFTARELFPRQPAPLPQPAHRQRLSRNRHNPGGGGAGSGVRRHRRHSGLGRFPLCGDIHFHQAAQGAQRLCTGDRKGPQENGQRGDRKTQLLCRHPQAQDRRQFPRFRHPARTGKGTDRPPDGSAKEGGGEDRKNGRGAAEGVRRGCLNQNSQDFRISRIRA